MKLVEQRFDILTPISVGGIDELQRIERAGRTCYKSEDKITDDGESAKKFVKMLIDRHHEAMLEHSSLTVVFTCSRGVSHEIVRHRLFSFAQESTRYCNYSKGKFGGSCTYIIPPELVGAKETDPGFIAWKGALQKAEDYYFELLGYGWKPEEARDVLPNALKTEIVVTGNYREWRHFLQLRCDKAAHPHIRELAQNLAMTLKICIPVVFDDIWIPVEHTGIDMWSSVGSDGVKRMWDS